MTRAQQHRGVVSSRPQQPDEITIVEAAALLNVAKTTVAHWVGLGRMPSRLAPRPDGTSTGLRVIKRADVEAYAARRAR